MAAITVEGLTKRFGEVLGTGLGALFRNQFAAVVAGLLLWQGMVEDVLVGVLDRPGPGRWSSPPTAWPWPCSAAGWWCPATSAE